MLNSAPTCICIIEVFQYQTTFKYIYSSLGISEMQPPSSNTTGFHGSFQYPATSVPPFSSSPASQYPPSSLAAFSTNPVPELATQPKGPQAASPVDGGAMSVQDPTNITNNPVIGTFINFIVFLHFIY